MLTLRNLIRRLTTPTITNRDEHVRYVMLVTLFALSVSLFADITSQLVFFTSWAAVARTFVVTTVTVGVIAIPVSYIFGRAQRDLQEVKRRLEHISYTDPMTGLPNRRAVIEASTVSAPQATIMVIAGIDQFNAINDSHGHKTSEVVLKTLGQTLVTHLSDFGLVGHMRREEFALVSSNVPVERIVSAIGDLLRAVERTPIVTPGGTLQVTMSAGIAVRSSSDVLEKLYADADEALYEAKRLGRGRIRLSGRTENGVLFGQPAETMSPAFSF